MSRVRLSSTQAIILFILAAGALFILDANMPAGIGDGVGYSGVMVLCLWMGSRRAILLCALLLSVQIIAGALLSPPGPVGEGTYINRALAFACVWAVAFLATQRMHFESSLVDTAEAAEAASAAKSKFLATVSHELRTPLNAILGMSEAINLGIIKGDSHRDYLNDIYRSARHLLSLVNDLLDAARIEAGQYQVHLETIDLLPRLHEAVAIMRPLAENGHLRLSLDPPERLPAVRADTKLVLQTMINLLSNAIKFTPVGGRVDITVRTGEDQVQIEIRDTGIGINAKDLPQLGRPFVQISEASTRSHGGAGLGLALAKSFTELQGGRLVIESVAGQGTSVRLTFPVADAVVREKVEAA
jgi:signal transduction histidine kinase